MFTRTVESFICEMCGYRVAGNGYTNHCPQCMWSKHVDIDPGDRAAGCGGLMQPVRVEYEHDTFVITHQCQQCGHRKRNKVSPEDDLESVYEVAQRENSLT